MDDGKGGLVSNTGLSRRVERKCGHRVSRERGHGAKANARERRRLPQKRRYRGKIRELRERRERRN